MTDSPQDDKLADFGLITLDSLYERHNRKLARYVARRVRDREATVTIVSNIWEATHVKFEKKLHPRDWHQFVWGIARNKVADWARSNNRKPDPIYLEPTDLERIASEVVDESRLERAEEEQRLRGALRKAMHKDLTDLQREAVLLRYVEEMTYPEIAIVMKSSRSVVKKHVERGMRNARKSMAKAGFFVPSTQEVK